ncbi:MAG: PhzF family phenazine biosynthesis protein [Actinomycetota bacterium]
MRIAFRLVDVFTPRPLAGNQLCVVPEPADLDHDQMLALAQEIGFSETTFVTRAAGDRYEMRIFTPDRELPFAGHPTIGTAFVLVSEGRVTSPATQVVPAGKIPVEVDVESGVAWMTQLPPEFRPAFEDRDLLARATGLAPEDLRTDVPAQMVTTGLPTLIVPVRDVETLRRARIDQPSVAEACERSGGDELYLFAVHDGGVTARFFGPTPAIVEDPATGSAAGPLGAYLAAHGLAGMPGAVTIHQGEQVGRPSELHVEVAPDGDSWRVRVGGGVRVVGDGAFHLERGARPVRPA